MATTTTEPLVPLGERAIEAIQKHALGKDAMQLKREYPKPVSRQSLRGRHVNDPDVLAILASHRPELLRSRRA